MHRARPPKASEELATDWPADQSAATIVSTQAHAAAATLVAWSSDRIGPDDRRATTTEAADTPARVTASHAGPATPDATSAITVPARAQAQCRRMAETTADRAANAAHVTGIASRATARTSASPATP